MAFDIKLDMSEIEALQGRLGAIRAEDLGRAVVETINRITNETYELARGRMIKTINLDDAYVRSRMQVREASAGKPIAEIVAQGGNPFLTGLGHYGALQEVKASKWDKEDGLERGRKIGPWPKWEDRKGDADRGIDAGDKQAGFSVAVTRGSRKTMRSVFTIPGKKHNDGSPVLFVGTGVGGSGKMDRNRKQSRQGVKALHGPSVYQLFKTVGAAIRDDVGDELERAIVDRVEEELRKAIE